MTREEKVDFLCEVIDAWSGLANKNAKRLLRKSASMSNENIRALDNLPGDPELIKIEAFGALWSAVELMGEQMNLARPACADMHADRPEIKPLGHSKL